MNASKSRDGFPGVVQTIGPKTLRFLWRFNFFARIGFIAQMPASKSFQGDKAKIHRQAKIISQQADIPVEMAKRALLAIRQNESAGLFDPLALPWLN